MSHLALFLLGSPRIELDGAPVRVDRRKSVALIAYLAITGESHSRDMLATLLWPEQDQSRARAGLRAALATLKKALGDGWLAVDRESAGLSFSVTPSTLDLQSAPERELWLDVAEFRGMLAECRKHDHPEEQVCPECLPILAEAVELYRDDFLAGFTLRDSPSFDEWQFFQTEGLRNELLGALKRLARGYAEQGESQLGIEHTRRWAALDPLHEPAHCQLMRLYAQSGQRAAALRQYETCCRVLRAELDAEPGAETRSLFQQIRTGEPKVSRLAPEHSLDVLPERPGFLTEDEDQVARPRPVFVARERELAQLDAHLAAALDGHGGVVFVTGEAGCGKTALLAEFARRAQEAHAGVIVTGGACNAFSGVGDPYLPFREVMGMLSGDVEAHWAAGLISRGHARRLWGMLPEVAQALVDRAPDLIDVFVAGKGLVSRATMAAPGGSAWIEGLKARIARGQAGAADLKPSQLMGQYTTLLQNLASVRPLLITLDDLQWVDVASVGLLFHLARHLAGSRVLLLGAYRSEEVALGRVGARSEDRGRHPLQKVLSELKRTHGDIWIDLSAVGEREGRAFVDALLDSEPNRLAEGFRQALFRQTDGHPLFTVELLRGMQERGNLVRDADQRWAEGSTLDWSTLPVRVQGVLEERIGRLERGQREILSVASVEGERFTAQVVARVRELDEGQVLRDLARLERRHRLVQEREGARVDGKPLSRYRFSHILFQRYLYGALSEAERRLLHGEIARILAELYQRRTDEITVQLAEHYAQAEEREKAVEYLLRAGDQARGLYAFPEAIDYYQRALAFLKEMEEHEQAARTLMRLGLTYHLALDFRRTRQAYEEGFALWRRAGEVHVRAPALPAPQTLRVGSENPIGLDPTINRDVYSVAVIEQLFSGVAEPTSEMGVVPDVAHSWEVSGGGQKYVFHLRGDVFWSDGAPVTAGDFEYAWKRTLDPATGLIVGGLMDDVKGARAYRQGRTSDPDRVGVRALDDVTLEVELEGPTGYFPHLLTVHVCHPVPRHIVEAHGEAWTDVEKIVTNGPFSLEAWQPGRSAVLVRNPTYHGRFTGNVQRLEISLLVDPSAKLELYEAGGLDILHLDYLPAADLDRARHRYAADYVLGPSTGLDYVGFDTSRPPFDDPRVRRAFVLATDRGRLADKALRGTQFPATGGYLPLGMPGHSAGIALPYDPQEARQLLAEAGYPGGRGFPVVEFSTAYRRRPTCEYLEAQWRENLGVEISEQIMPWAMWHDRLFSREPLHIYCGGAPVIYPDPADFMRAPVFQHLTRWENRTYERLVDEARWVTEPGRRIGMYQEADRIIMEEAPIMPLAYGFCHLLVKPWVRRWPMSPTRFWFWKDVIIDPH